MEKPTRVEYLETGIKLTSGDRDKEYGTPYINLDNCADLWSAYLRGRYMGRIPGFEQTVGEFRLTAEDVAWLNVLQKIARTFSDKVRPDTYIDAATYAAIAGECALEEDQ